MSYELRFHKTALREWRKLPPIVRDQFKKKLVQRLEEPCVVSAAVSGGRDIYKIKLRQLGYRLVYAVDEGVLTVTVVTVGKRNRNEVYVAALSRIREG